ncbi:MAG TPA: crosslink repair DNA glycosylase YcaQ family protein [Candidatus Saccharimonadales bacterium]|nr:crosslink repair DNA glycosylase YcaQ family protein [Candidatus Saccharimonadales bacterium]
MDISLQTARRYVMGRQGLWPGRRWRGIRGTERAMHAVEHLQLDPLAILARAQDLMLASRVIDYRPDDWATLTYDKRRFFDWGGWLAVRPMEDLPHWRTLMARERDAPRWREILREHRPAIEEMRAYLHEHGTVRNRDLKMSSRTRVQSYRGRKDSAVALYYLWRTGEAMVTRREGFERVYAPAEAVAPPALLRASPDAEADEHHLRTMTAFAGLTRFPQVSAELERPVSAAELSAWREARIASGDLLEVRVEGWRAPRWALGEDEPILRTLEAGRIPRAWRPLDTTTTEEATFLSPLDPVSARGRAKPLFDFDYIWEVYTPLPKRRFGYYVLPVLWGDRLVARFDAKLDRSTRTLAILGLWFEDAALARDAAFIEAFGRGMDRFRTFLDADRVAAGAVEPMAIRRRIEAGFAP